MELECAACIAQANNPALRVEVQPADTILHGTALCRMHCRQALAGIPVLP